MRKVTIAAVVLAVAAVAVFAACLKAGTPPTSTMRAGNIRW